MTMTAYPRVEFTPRSVGDNASVQQLNFSQGKPPTLSPIQILEFPCLRSKCQWEFQDPEIRQYFVETNPYIALT